MKKKKVFALFTAAAMLIGAAGCGNVQSETAESAASAESQPVETQKASEGISEEATVSEATGEAAGPGTEVIDYGGIELSFMVSKPELKEALEEITAEWGAERNVSFTIYTSDDPANTLAQKYAAGDPPVLAIVDPANVTEMAEEKFLPLENEAWVADGGDAMGTKVNDVLYGFPLCVEATGMVYNKTAIENMIGKEFVPADYSTPEKFQALLEELRAGGMENPVILNSETWSLGGHLLGALYTYQPGADAASSYEFVKGIKNGEKVSENAMFQNLMTDYDMFIEYNINKDDPLAADYDLNASYLAEGEAAFWINGTWVWPDMEPYVDDSMDYGVMPLPISDPELTGTVYAWASKQISIDKEVATQEQQAAAKDFLNWLVYTAEGQDALVNRCAIVVAFTNNTLEPTNPVNAVLKTYIDSGMTHNNAPYSGPTDHTSEMAPHMQAYMAGEETAEDIAAALEEYWQTREPR